MAVAHPELALTPDLRSLLAGLRWRIRLYIWLEGLALAVIWLGVMFWIGFALDYLPVLVGASEMPAAARGVLLAGTGIVLGWIFFRWILRRAFVPLADRSLALLLERQFAGFDDSLVTAVEMAEVPDHATAFSRELLGRTTEEARAGADAVIYRRVFNQGALAWKLLLAAVVGGSIVAFSALNSVAFERAAERLYLLSNEPWPRSAFIEVDGIEVIRQAAIGEDSPRSLVSDWIA